MEGESWKAIAFGPETGEFSDFTIKNWGGWGVDVKNLLLVHEDPDYEVDLRECTDSAKILDWILQVECRPWATPEVVAGLVSAIDDLLKPQRNMCSMGTSTAITKKDIRAAVKGWFDSAIKDE